MNNITAYILLFICAFLGAYGATFIVRKWAESKQLFDKPARRKVHTRKIPTLGGIAIWLGFNLAMWLAFFLLPELRAGFGFQFMGISIGLFVIFVTGIVDDLRDLNAKFKLVIQIVVAIMLIIYGFEIDLITNPLGDGSQALGILSVFITIIWIVGMINAINLLDGLDGLAAGVSAIAVFFLFIAAVQMNMLAVAVLSICLIGALAGFLPHNFFPAKIFMGNTGSMFLGLILSIIAIAGFQKRTAVFTLFVPFMAMAIPILDTFLSIFRRFMRRQPIFKADKEHIHHKLLKLEHSQSRVVISLYFLTGCFGLIALGFSRLQGGYALIALVIVAVVTIKWLKSWGFLDFK
ncbi:MAG: MraY family glycosyltransferase [Candidatus Omnitrophota bacterium]